MMRLTKAVRLMTSLVGIDIFRHKPGWHWSHTAETYYPVFPRPRWGHGNPLHGQLEEVFETLRPNFKILLQQMSPIKSILEQIPSTTADAKLPWWQNTFFSSLDAAALVGMLSLKKPNKYVEIGSGNSTKFARFAIEKIGLPTSLISIDPFPRAEIDDLCDRLVRTPFEECSSMVLSEVSAGDILFFDGSHRTFTNSDVTVFFLEVLPRLPPGVFVHIHDIFLPADYPPDWNRRMYSEQYVLAAMLLGKAQPFKTLLPNYFACIDDQIKPDVAALVQPHKHELFGGSFWLETT
jgi:hypothetical protein